MLDQKIKTIDLTFSLAQIDDSKQIPKKNEFEVESACIDTKHYQVMSGFVKPESVLRIYDFIDTNQCSLAESVPFPKAIVGVCFIPNILPGGKDLVVIGTQGGTIHLWDQIHQKSIAKLSGHLTAPRVFKFDRNSKYLASGGEDTNIKVWDMASPNKSCLMTFK